MTLGRRRVSAALIAVAAFVAGCGAPLDGGPLGPCGDDANAAGGYPELESLLPTALGADGRAPTRVDSRRSCSTAALSTLKSHGVTELRGAGATWEDGASEGTVIALLATPNWIPPLEEAWVEEWYEQGARTARKTDNIKTSRPQVAPVGEVFRLDTVNDLSYQTVVTWQANGRTHVVIVASDVAPGKDISAHDAKVTLAVAAAAAAPGG